MLNRRTIRIKAMQSIFAYEQCKEANYHLALDQISDKFSKDLNSMEVQDKDLLKEQSQEATKIFKARFKNKGKKVKDSDTDIINDEVNSAIKGYYDHLSKDSRFLKKEMLKDAELIYARFGWLLYWLDAMVKTLAIHKLKKGIYTYSNLIENQVIKKILEHKGLSKAFIKSSLTWDDHQDETLVWLNEVLLKDEQIIDYLDLEKPRFEDDKEIVQYIYKSAIFKNAEIIGLFMEQADLYWSENKAILRSMVLKTIKSVEADNEDFDLAELSYNWEEDKQFFETIFDQTVKESVKYEKIIADKTLNWDIDRISDTDRILLQMAIQEMINFPGIPLKVTINEYIEVSKKYSTPKSKQFINGVLDVIAVDLQKEGVIKKSGRGLIDNK